MEHIEILIKSLRTYHPGFSYEILVCDNGSTDGSDHYLENLEEVKLWRIPERGEISRPISIDQKMLISKFQLEPFLHPYFINSIESDPRKTHYESLNFLLKQVSSPLFATIDTDIEFLGPNWLEPFLLPMLINPKLDAVGVKEESLKLEIGKFKGTTAERMHPCFALYRTKSAWQNNIDWRLDPHFDLRMLFIQKCLEQDIELHIPLNDVGHKIINQLKTIVFIEAETFYKNVRHFLGSTVKKDYDNELWFSWLNSIKENPTLKPLYEYANHNVDYAKLGNTFLEPIQKYWKQKNPVLQKNKDIDLFYL